MGEAWPGPRCPGKQAFGSAPAHVRFGPIADITSLDPERGDIGDCVSVCVDLLGGEAVKETVAAGGNQVLLGATAGRVGSIPGTSKRHIRLRILGAGHRRKSRAINVSEHGDTRATAGPVSTGEVHVGRKGMTVLV
jgi:hypothetical protein